MFLILIFFAMLWSEDQNPKDIANLSVTSGIFSGFKISFGKASITNNKSSELTLNYKADLKVTSKPQMNVENSINNIYLQWNRFYNPNRTKSFLILKGGIFWYKMGDWFGGSGKKSTLTLPVISIGYGYSFKLNERSFIRPSIDLGFQVNIINIELSYLFDM
jgi:hypothetical protein